MVSKHSIENFIKRSVWKLTRSSDIIKYVPKSIHNGIVVGDCAVIKNKKETFDVYSRNRKPIKKDISNHKIAICIATVMNQYNDTFKEQLQDLRDLDMEYAVALGNYDKYKLLIDEKPHLTDEYEQWEEEVIVITDRINDVYASMTL